MSSFVVDSDRPVAGAAVVGVFHHIRQGIAINIRARPRKRHLTTGHNLPRRRRGNRHARHVPFNRCLLPEQWSSVTGPTPPLALSVGLVAHNGSTSPDAHKPANNTHNTSHHFTGTPAPARLIPQKARPDASHVRTSLQQQYRSSTGNSDSNLTYPLLRQSIPNVSAPSGAVRAISVLKADAGRGGNGHWPCHRAGPSTLRR